MANLNKVFLMGNLTRDVDLRFTPSGAAVASFGLAINRKYKQGEEWKEETCFVDITVWGKQAENCAQYISKGQGVMVEGRLSFRTWETEEGQKRSKLDVVAINVQFLSKEGQASEPQNNEPQNNAEGDNNPDVPF